MATKGSGDSAGSKADAGAGGAPFGDIQKLIEQFKLPGVDVKALMEGRRKDIEAVTAANKRAYEGMKSLAERQAEMLKESMEEMKAAVKELSDLPAAERAARTAEMGKEALEKALANMRELAESSVKSQSEAWNIVGEQFKQNLADLKKALRKE